MINTKNQTTILSPENLSLSSEITSMYSHFNGLLRYWSVITELKKYKNKKKSILDIGCGQGPYSLYLSHLFKFYLAFDISFRNILFLKNRVKNLKINNIFVLLANGIKMPFRAKSFDVILISEVLEHIPPEIIPQMFSEINRILKPDGILFLTVPSIFLDFRILRENKIMTIVYSYFIKKIIKKRIMRNRINIRGRFHNFFTKNELKRIFLNNNFEIIKMKYCVKYKELAFYFITDLLEKLNYKKRELNKNRNQKSSDVLIKMENFLNIDLIPYKIRFFEHFPFFGKHIIVIATKIINK